MADGQPGVRQQVAQSVGDILNVEDAVVQIENLAAAIEFALDRVAHQAVVVLGDDGLDGEAVLGRRLDGAHVARAGQG